MFTANRRRYAFSESEEDDDAVEATEPLPAWEIDHDKLAAELEAQAAVKAAEEAANAPEQATGRDYVARMSMNVMRSEAARRLSPAMSAYAELVCSYHTQGGNGVLVFITGKRAEELGWTKRRLGRALQALAQSGLIEQAVAPGPGRAARWRLLGVTG